MRIKREYLLDDRQINATLLEQSLSTHGLLWTKQMLKQSFIEGLLDPAQVSPYLVAKATGADKVYQRTTPTFAGGFISTANLTEAEAVDVTAFADITGQITYTMIKDSFLQADQGLFDALANVVPTSFDGEKIPMIGEITDEGAVVHAGMPFPYAGFGSHRIETPSTVKTGMIVAVTKEAIFFDRTGGRVARQASTVGRRLATMRLKEFLRTFAGIDNTYSYDGTDYDTYQTAGTYWTNTVAKTLTDYTDIDEARQLANNMTDPDTGEPIELVGSTLILMPAGELKANRIVYGDTVDQGAISATVPITRSPNPISDRMVSQIISSATLRNLIDVEGSVTQAQADTWWFLGDPKRAFAYMQNWPLTVVMAPPQNPAEFERDIVLQYKASERGVPAVMEPRYMLRFTNA